MNWPLFLQLLTSAIIAFSSAWLAHVFTANRDRRNKRHDERITFLIDAYRRLELSSNRQPLADFASIESAIADIQLLGSPDQVNLAQDFIKKFKTNSSASPDDILRTLRKDLRTELQLQRVSDKLFYLRFKQTNKSRSATGARPYKKAPFRPARKLVVSPP